MIKLTLEQIEEAYDYMKFWYDSEYFTDFQIYYNGGDAHVIADELVSAGAINSKLCFDHAAKDEKIVEKLSKEFRKLPHKEQAKRRDKAWKMHGPVHVSECLDCNFHQFLNEGNENIYGDQLNHCWQCNSTNVENYKSGKHKTKLQFNGKEWIKKGKK